MNAIIRFPSKEAALGLYNDPDSGGQAHPAGIDDEHISMVVVDEFGA